MYRPVLWGYFKPVDYKRTGSTFDSIPVEQREPSQNVKNFAAEVFVDHMLSSGETPQAIMTAILKAKRKEIESDVELLSPAKRKEQYSLMEFASLDTGMLSKKIEINAHHLEHETDEKKKGDLTSYDEKLRGKKHQKSFNIQTSINNMNDEQIKKALIDKKLVEFRNTQTELLATMKEDLDAQTMDYKEKVVSTWTQQVETCVATLAVADKNDKGSFMTKMNAVLSQEYCESLFKHFQRDPSNFDVAKNNLTLALKNAVVTVVDKGVDEVYQQELKNPTVYFEPKKYRKLLISMAAALDERSMNHLAVEIGNKSALINTLDEKLAEKYNWSDATAGKVFLGVMAGMISSAGLGLCCLIAGTQKTKDFAQMQSLHDGLFYLIMGSLMLASIAAAFCARPADIKGAKVEQAEFAKLGFKPTA